MKRTLGKLGLMALAIVVILAQREAQASTSTTLQDWKDTGTVSVGDKDWTYIDRSSNFSGTTTLNFDQSGNSYDLLQSPLSSLVSGTYTLEYSVTITSPNFAFDQVHLDSTWGAVGNHGSVTKDVYSDAFVTKINTLVSVNGSNPPDQSIGGFLTKVWVRDTIVITQDKALRSADNAFTQKQVPEPATLALWGGTVGLGLLFGRRRK